MKKTILAMGMAVLLVSPIFSQTRTWSQDFDKSLAEHNEIIGGGPRSGELLESYDVGAVMTPAVIPYGGRIIPLVVRLADDPDWALVSAEPGLLLFIRSDRIRESGSGGSRGGLDKKTVWSIAVAEALANIGSYPDRAESYRSMADAYLRLGYYADAGYWYEEYLARNPGDAEAARILSLIGSMAR